MSSIRNMSKPSTKRKVTKCLKLSELCADSLAPFLHSLAKQFNPGRAGPLDKLASELIEMMMERAYNVSRCWEDYWVLFLTPKIRRAYLPWDRSIWNIAKKRCKCLIQVRIISMAAIRFNNSMLDSLPSSVTTIDFHGDLYYRDRTILKMDNQSTSWLPDTEFWLRRLKLEMTKQPSLEPGSLREIHFGEVKVTGAEIAEILKSFPQLAILRHYQLTTGLCLLHGKDWEKTEANLPKYNLTNIDADFSHVIRCRMSPEAVLPSDALKLAVTVCPKATSVNLRYDCSTPHHIVGYLTSLTRLQELSAVCVTSGERTLLDFNDLVPILEKFGPKTLKSLELKVLEEVDPHVIAHVCPQLTRLILSGCGYVTPSTCSIYRCLTSSKRLPKLKLLFYADGDDFSWDHSLPQCFWKSVLESDIRQPNILEGIFLESPRMTVETLTYLLNENADFPNLQVFSICRASELNLSHLQSLSRAVNKLNYLRITDCEQIGIRLGARIIQMFRGAEVKIES